MKSLVTPLVVCVPDVIASRGERLELLVDKAEDLSNSVCASFSVVYYVFLCIQITDTACLHSVVCDFVLVSLLQITM